VLILRPTTLVAPFATRRHIVLKSAEEFALVKSNAETFSPVMRHMTTPFRSCDMSVMVPVVPFTVPVRKLASGIVNVPLSLSIARLNDCVRESNVSPVKVIWPLFVAEVSTLATGTQVIEVHSVSGRLKLLLSSSVAVVVGGAAGGALELLLLESPPPPHDAIRTASDATPKSFDSEDIFMPCVRC